MPDTKMQVYDLLIAELYKAVEGLHSQQILEAKV